MGGPKPTASPNDQPAKDLVWFCPLCYASEDGGSGGYPAAETHCLNCGASRSAIHIPRWAIKCIREQAAFVGTRYYPSDETREEAAELRTLRAMAPSNPGRTARKLAAHPGDPPNQWEVRQHQGGDRCTSIFVTATSAGEALAKAKTSLPYVPQADLDP